MTPVPLKAHLEQATSVLDLAQRLGRSCLREEKRLRSLLRNDVVATHSKFLEGVVEDIDPHAWQLAGARGGFAQLLDVEQPGSVFERVGTLHPVVCRAVLRGLCRRALPLFYGRTTDCIELTEGTPVPFATRPIPDLYGDEPITPSQPRLQNRRLLHGIDYDLFAGDRQDAVRVALDFSHRVRLDELTWLESKRLPRIATLHPFLGTGHMAVTVRGSCFFDVAPTQWVLADTLAQLHRARTAPIAVLPELALPSPDALAAELQANHERYSPLVVAGSAHVRMRSGSRLEVRANESRVYLDGRQICVHRKLNPLVTARLGDRRLEREMVEDITEEPKVIRVLSGTHTRLAVVICADINDRAVLRLLEDAGVNLLLVPALTYATGAFNGAVCGLASRCQAVSVIVNADLDLVTSSGRKPKRPPFHIIVGVPRSEPQDQSREYRFIGDRRPPLGLVNPNLELARAVRWL
jgi:hypothetical protein